MASPSATWTFLKRARLADDPADPSVGHFYIETIHLVQYLTCEHRQERLHRRSPDATLRKVQSQRDAHLLGEG